MKYDRPVLPITLSFRLGKGLWKLIDKSSQMDLNIGDPIFPDKELPRLEAVQKMQQETYHIMQVMNGIHPGGPTYNTDQNLETYQKTMREGIAVRKLFPKEYWLSWVFAAALFGLLFPGKMFGNPDILVHYAVFCVALGGISAVLIRTIVLRIWVRRFYPDTFRVYAWFLAVEAFCHLVFTGMNPLGWVYIGLSAALELWMGIAWLKEWKKEQKK